MAVIFRFWSLAGALILFPSGKSATDLVQLMVDVINAISRHEEGITIRVDLRARLQPLRSLHPAIFRGVAHESRDGVSELDWEIEGVTSIYLLLGI